MAKCRYCRLSTLTEYSRAKSDLIGEFVTISNTKQQIDTNQNETEKKLLAEGTRAIRAILGYRRSSVELL